MMVALSAKKGKKAQHLCTLNYISKLYRAIKERQVLPTDHHPYHLRDI